VLDEGKIIELGTYRELIGNEKHFAELMRTYAGREENEEDVFEDSKSGSCVIVSRVFSTNSMNFVGLVTKK
jgi:hypothetical protein